MKVVLNEEEYAKNAISERSLGKSPYDTLVRVAKYYLSIGLSDTEVEQRLNTFILQCEPDASIPKWSKMVEFAINRACKSDIIKIDHIDITRAEIDKIEALQGKQLKRLAFTLLCLAKYWDQVNPYGDHWVNTEDNEIMSMANINTSIKRQSLMYAQLKDAGLIRFSKKVDNTNVRVCFIDDDSDSVMGIDDFRNLGYQWSMYSGEKYAKCESCGITYKRNEQTRGRPQKYCKDCAIKIRVKQNIESTMRHRSFQN